MEFIEMPGGRVALPDLIVAQGSAIVEAYLAAPAEARARMLAQLQQAESLRLEALKAERLEALTAKADYDAVGARVTAGGMPLVDLATLQQEG